MIETAPAFASLLVHYEPVVVGFSAVVDELRDLVRSLGPSDNLVLDSRLFYLPTAYLDPWSRRGLRALRREDRQEDAGPAADRRAQWTCRRARAGAHPFGHRILGRRHRLVARRAVHACARSPLQAVGPAIQPAAGMDEEGHGRAGRLQYRHLSGGPAGRHPDLRTHSGARSGTPRSASLSSGNRSASCGPATA